MAHMLYCQIYSTKNLYHFKHIPFHIIILAAHTASAQNLIIQNSSDYVPFHYIAQQRSPPFHYEGQQ